MSLYQYCFCSNSRRSSMFCCMMIIIIILVCLELFSIQLVQDEFVILDDEKYSLQNKYTRPNILIIVADDLGWSEINYNNINHKNSRSYTPNINKYAKQYGLILKRHYTYCVCTPTRASFITGRYPIYFNLHRLLPSSATGTVIPLEYKILPEILELNNYNTSLIGKFHAGDTQTWDYTPYFRGYNYFFGFLEGMGTYFTHFWKSGVYDLLENVKKVASLHQNHYKTYLFGNKTLNIVKYYNEQTQKLNKNETLQPFFIQLCYNAIHTPLEYPLSNNSFIEYFDEYKYVMQEDKKRLILTSLLDESVGEILDYIFKSDTGLWHNTLIIFFSDNGGVDSNENYPLRAGKRKIYEGGIRTVAFITGGYLNKHYFNIYGKTFSKYIHISDWYPTLLSFANIDYKLYNVNFTKHMQIPDTLSTDGIDQSILLKSLNKFNNKSFILRNEIFINTFDDHYGSGDSGGGIIQGKYKYITGSTINAKQHPNQGYFRLNLGYGWSYLDFFLNDTQYENTNLTCCFDKSNELLDEYLFNIIDDPSETYDLKYKYPKIYNKLKSKYLQYRNYTLTHMNKYSNKGGSKITNGYLMPNNCQQEYVCNIVKQLDSK